MNDTRLDDSDKKRTIKDIKEDALVFKRIVNRELDGERTMGFYRFISTGVCDTPKGKAYRIFFRVHKSERNRVYAYATKSYKKKSITVKRMIELAKVIFNIVENIDESELRNISTFKAKMKF